MTSWERNPFIQDVERQQVRSRFSLRQRFASRVWTAIVSIVVILALIYVINLFGIRHQKPHDVSGPVQRWPVNTDALKISEEVPYDRPVRQWPTNEASPTETGIMQNNPLGTMNRTTPIWTHPIWTTSISELASQSGTTVQTEHRLQQAFEPTIDPALTSTVHHEMPPASLCISLKLAYDEYQEKLVICHNCWSGNYSRNFKSEEDHYHSCYSNCFDNDIFKQCAFTLEMILLLQAKA